MEQWLYTKSQVIILYFYFYSKICSYQCFKTLLNSKKIHNIFQFKLPNHHIVSSVSKIKLPIKFQTMFFLLLTSLFYILPLPSLDLQFSFEDRSSKFLNINATSKQSRWGHSYWTMRCKMDVSFHQNLLLTSRDTTFKSKLKFWWKERCLNILFKKKKD